MNALEIRIVNKSKHPIPHYATLLSAGMDLRADVQTPLTLNPGDRAIIPTGIFIEIPVGYEAQVRPRSGLAFKFGVTVLNSPGTIDSDYRGEVGVILINHGVEPFIIEDGERIAQLVIAAYTRVVWTETENLSETDRGAGGFGSTGKK